MQTYRASVIAMVKRPSGWVPLALSVFCVLLLIAALGLTVQVAPDAPGEVHDEGPLARLYQLIMLVELVLIGWFALRWASRDIKAGATVIALQVLAIAASFVPLLIIES